MSRRLHQHGVSLVEFMVSMTLGLLLMAAVIAALSTVFQTRTRKAELERSLEAYRFITYTLAERIRTACAVASTSTADRLDLRHLKTVAYTQDSPPPPPHLTAGTVVIELDPRGRGSIDVGDRLVVEGLPADTYVVQAGDPDVSNGGSVTINPGLTANIDQPRARLTVFTTQSITLNGSNSITLSQDGGPAQSMIDGVFSLAFAYGESTAPATDRISDSEYTATAGSENVRSVKITVRLLGEGSAAGVKESFVVTLRSKMLQATESLTTLPGDPCPD